MISSELPPALVLTGPTASGKSRVAIELARYLPCEIVSVDSALVYRGMDIGTAKPDRATLAQVPHHLIDLLEPTARYSAAQFIDASGDADIAHFAGVPYKLGDGAGDALYPSTMFRVGGVDATRALAAIGEFKAIDTLMAQAADRYDFPRIGAILRPQRDTSQRRANVTQLRKAQGRAVDATDALQLSAAETAGRRQAVECMRLLRAEVPGFEWAEVAEIGVVEGWGGFGRLISLTAKPERPVTFRTQIL